MTERLDKPVSAVVFAYNDIGVRALEAMLALDVDIRLIVTHRDNPLENIWFQSVAATAQNNNIAFITPENPNSPDVNQQVAACKPDYIFSFYFREMLGPEVLAIPNKGAYNLHGSLLPQYRGRVPINWAIIHGESQTGMSLHRMEIKPDAGALLAQKAVPILRNDTAFEVSRKLLTVAEQLLLEVLPQLFSGQATETPMDLQQGSYFSGRKPQDGRIEWHRPAVDIHNLIRAVAPPFPGAFFQHGNHTIGINRSYYRAEKAHQLKPCLYHDQGRFYADCSDGERFLITELLIDGREAGIEMFEEHFGQKLSPVLAV